MENSKPANFREIIIPGDVLDNDVLSDGAKILYGKIARLSYKTGYCWATNEFLGGTKTGRTAARQIKELVDAGYLKSHIESDSTRKLYVCEINTKIKENPHDKNVIPPHDKSDLQTLQDSTNLNLTAAAGPPADPPPDEKPAAAAPPITLQELREALLGVDKTLYLKTAFYPQAAAFMTQYGLDKGYIAWLYRQCELRKPDSLKGLYFTLFFETDMAEQYTAVRKASTAPPQPPPEVNCPVCGTLHAKHDDVCPSCRLRKDAAQEEIQFFRDLHSLTPEKHSDYLRREDAIFKECGKDFKKLKSMIDSLKNEFGLAAGL